jgi:DNA primase
MQLPEMGDLLVITKSMKDVMVLHEMKIPAVSVSSESSFLKDDLIAELKTRFQRIYILFDNDKAGNENSLKFEQKHNIPRIVIPDELGGKDVSDAVKTVGFKETEQWLNQATKK